MKKIPYSHLHICGPVLFCARGGRIHSFRLNDGTHLSTWHHPDTDGNEARPGPDQPRSAAPVGNPTGEEPHVADAEPPAKRQRLEEDREAIAEAEVADEEAQGMAAEGGRPAKGTGEVKKGQCQGQGRAQGQGTGRGGKKIKKDERLRTRNAIAKVPDRPLICIITSTTDRAHVLAVSGHDKTIWVFEHDGRGSLNQLSQRTMPKRPCSALISPDNQTILSADKFGDVYSLPLLPSATGSCFSSPSGGPSAAPKHTAKTNKPQATALTVHSKANRVALSNQLRMAGAGQGTPRNEPARFELTLQLGHVSMLTAMVLARHRERGYIITADRDEHIRVSRFLPQAHVIEGYCLGHTRFVSSLAILPSRPDLLVSGGGDGDLFVWDWRLAKLRHREDLLGRVREVCGAEVDQVAVASLLAVTGRHGHEDCTRVVAICEDVPALFWWTVAAGPGISLEHGGIVRLAGNPLHIANWPEEDGRFSSAILVALDAADGGGGGSHDQVDDPPRPGRVAALRWGESQGQEATLGLQPDHILQDGEIEALEPAVAALAVRDLLYTTAILRKRVGDDAAAAEVTEHVAADVAEDGSAEVGRDAAAEVGGGGIEAAVE